MCALLALLVLSPLASAAATEREKLIVLEIVPGDESTRRTARLVEEQILTELAGLGRYDVAGQSEIGAVLGVERQKELLGCSDTQGSCLAEIGGALGARWMVMGTLGRFGSKLRIDLKLIDAKTGKAARREGRVLDSDDELFPSVTQLLRALVAPGETAPASGSSRPVGPFIAGGVGLVVGIVGGLLMGFGALQGGELNKDRGTLPWHEAQSRMGLFQGLYWGGLAAIVVGAVFVACPIAVLIRGTGPAAAKVTVGSGGGLEVQW